MDLDLFLNMTLKNSVEEKFCIEYAIPKNIQNCMIYYLIDNVICTIIHKLRFCKIKLTYSTNNSEPLITFLTVCLVSV